MAEKGSRWLFLFAFSLSLGLGASPSYPIIEELNSNDSLFRQWQNRLRQSYRKDLNAPLLFFAYQVKKGDTFASLSAKSNGWQASLASLNGLSGPEDLTEGQWILFPSQKGVFIYEPPQGELQELMMASRAKEQAQEIHLWREGRKYKVYFFPFEAEKEKGSGDFENSERFFFLDSSFSFPLRNFVITSGFGWRSSPISRQRVYHKGIDLAAPFGTLAYPARAGKVSEVGYNEVYGHYVLIQHNNGYESLYGHFQRVLIKEGDRVEKLQPIGEVGDTGMSTGPHLHFEIYKKGTLQNPSNIFGGKR